MPLDFDDYLRSGLQEVQMPYNKKDEPEVKAQEMGLRMVVPKGDELQIDIDTAADYALFLKQMEILEQNIAVRCWSAAPSKSGGERQHITVIMEKPVTADERIALQAVLGSDRVRELLSLIRLKEGHPVPTVFFEKHDSLPEGAFLTTGWGLNRLETQAAMTAHLSENRTDLALDVLYDLLDDLQDAQAWDEVGAFADHIMEAKELPLSVHLSFLTSLLSVRDPRSYPVIRKVQSFTQSLAEKKLGPEQAWKACSGLLNPPEGE